MLLQSLLLLLTNYYILGPVDNAFSYVTAGLINSNMAARVSLSQTG